MIWTGRPDEAAALGLLLDRTYADAATAAEHPRLLDREFLIGQFDLWTNHLLPAISAGTAPPWTRRSAARAVWHRLGSVAGADHRRWMADHLDGLGLDPITLLGAERAGQPPFRSGDGRLIATAQPLTAEAAKLIGADYDLTEGTIVGARMDVHGPDPQRIGGFLKLSAGSRRFTEAPAPELHFRFDDATSFGFPHAERGSVRLTGQPAFVVTGDEVSLDVPGADLRLVGRNLTWYPHDLHWAESAAAQASSEGEGADETTSDLPSPGSRGTDLLGPLQYMLMVQLRMMRHAGLLRRGELAAAAGLCGGLNAELFRVRPAALRARWAARRTRTLLATEDSRAHALLRQIGRRMPLELPELPGATVPPAPVRITIGTAARLLDEVDFTGGRLRFVDVSADHRPGRADQTVIHLDARRGGRDTIVVIVLTEPLGCAPLTVTPDGLTLARRPALEATADDIALTVPLPGGDWTVRAAAGSWYVD